MCPALTADQLEDLKHDLLGTCGTVEQALARLGIDTDPEEAEERLLDGNPSVELCGGCEWWFESCCLEFDETRSAGFCCDCWPEGHDE